MDVQEASGLGAAYAKDMREDTAASWASGAHGTTMAIRKTDEFGSGRGVDRTLNMLQSSLDKAKKIDYWMTDAPPDAKVTGEIWDVYEKVCLSYTYAIPANHRTGSGESLVIHQRSKRQIG